MKMEQSNPPALARLSEGLGAWQPIETAPRDGTWLLLAGGECDYDESSDNKGRIVSAQWTTKRNSSTAKGHWQFAWYDGGYYGEYENPTHWMPLPAPPVSA
jgi:hypothetical protein